jgi:hypothetical protein
VCSRGWNYQFALSRLVFYSTRAFQSGSPGRVGITCICSQPLYLQYLSLAEWICNRGWNYPFALSALVFYSTRTSYRRSVAGLELSVHALNPCILQCLILPEGVCSRRWNYQFAFSTLVSYSAWASQSWSILGLELSVHSLNPCM